MDSEKKITLALTTAIGLAIGYLVFGVLVVVGTRINGHDNRYLLVALGMIALFCLGAVVALVFSLRAVMANHRSIRAWFALLLSTGEVIAMTIMVYKIYHVHF